MNFDLDQEPQGLFVRDKEGNFYFLPTDEAKQFAVHSNDASMVRKLWDSEDCSARPPEGATARHVNVSCAFLKNYLDTRFIDDHWRQVSLIWADQCL